MTSAITMLVGTGFTTVSVSTSSLTVMVSLVLTASGTFFPGTVVLLGAFVVLDPPAALVVFAALLPVTVPELDRHVGIPERQSTEPVVHVGA